jgi:hypothetical protein
MPIDLYKTDYYLWVRDTVKQLQNKEFQSLDLQNLIEEISDLGRRDKRKLKSLLRNLIEHLLKLKYWESQRSHNHRHWQAEIVNFRKQIKDQLDDSPSLKTYLQEVFLESYQDGREIASMRSGLPLKVFPEIPIADLEQVLDKNWFPASEVREEKDMKLYN